MAKVLEQTMGYAESQLGTARYMSPERARGEDHSHKSDVWSLGLIIGECATCAHLLPPTQGFYELFLLVAFDPPPRLDPSLYSAGLCSYVASCLSSQPEDRATAAELATNVWAASFGEGVGHGRAALADWIAAARALKAVTTTKMVTAAAAAAAVGERGTTAGGASGATTEPPPALSGDDTYFTSTSTAASECGGEGGQDYLAVSEEDSGSDGFESAEDEQLSS